MVERVLQLLQRVSLGALNQLARGAVRQKSLRINSDSRAQFLREESQQDDNGRSNEKHGSLNGTEDANDLALTPWRAPEETDANDKAVDGVSHKNTARRAHQRCSRQ